MADIKLYNIKGGVAIAKSPIDLKLEKEIQKLCENNLEVFFGIKFLASEYSTGKNHKGRIDSLGIDENNCPVIIEYKLDSKENVINQGLFYLDWLMDHKADFELLCMKVLGAKLNKEIDWTSPRLLCVAKDFTRYDDHAISQINRNIELIRYRIFEGDNIIFELASSVQNTPYAESGESKVKSYNYKTVNDILSTAPKELKELYNQIDAYLLGIGDDVQKKELKFYHAYTKIKNFACVEVRPQDRKILIYVKVDFNSIKNPASNIRDLSNIGHFGTGDTEIVIKSFSDIENAKFLIEESYNMS